MSHTPDRLPPGQAGGVVTAEGGVRQEEVEGEEVGECGGGGVREKAQRINSAAATLACRLADHGTSFTAAPHFPHGFSPVTPIDRPYALTISSGETP
jgi:hypothetical protein